MVLCDTFIFRYHKVVIMPRAGEGRSVRIDPEVYEALLALKRGNMTFSDVIAKMLHDCYGWSDEFATGQIGLEEFIDIQSK
jgi:predicted CopG family antitoxin